MASVYSTRFNAGTVAIAAAQQPRAAVDYTVPSGFRAVVRSIYMSQTGSGTFVGSVTVQGLCYIFRSSDLTAGATASLECNQVVNAGEVISAFAELGTGFVMVSGFLLTEQP